MTNKEIDFALMRSIQSGDETAFSILVQRYRDRLIMKIGQILSSDDDAKDIVQETFIRVWNKSKSFDFRYCLSTWNKYIVEIYPLLQFAPQNYEDMFDDN